MEQEMWLTRNMDKSLYLSVGDKPIKQISMWSISVQADFVVLDSCLFPEVKWSDEEPTKVKLVIEKQYGKDKGNTTKCTTANTEID